MKRRAFLGMIGAAAVAPAIPMRAASAPVAAAYNRYMYGLAVFHARTRASLSAGDLMAKLRISAVQANAMMGELTATGVVRPIAQSAVGAVRAVHPTTVPKVDGSSRKIAKKITDAAKSALEDTLESVQASDAPRADEIETVETDEVQCDGSQEDS